MKLLIWLGTRPIGRPWDRRTAEKEGDSAAEEMEIMRTKMNVKR